MWEVSPYNNFFCDVILDRKTPQLSRLSPFEFGVADNFSYSLRDNEDI